MVLSEAWSIYNTSAWESYFAKSPILIDADIKKIDKAQASSYIRENVVASLHRTCINFFFVVAFINSTVKRRHLITTITS